MRRARVICAAMCEEVRHWGPRPRGGGEGAGRGRGVARQTSQPTSDWLPCWLGSANQNPRCRRSAPIVSNCAILVSWWNAVICYVARHIDRHQKSRDRRIKCWTFIHLSKAQSRPSLSIIAACCYRRVFIFWRWVIRQSLCTEALWLTGTRSYADGLRQRGIGTWWQTERQQTSL